MSFQTPCPDQDRERRLALLIQRLPARLQAIVRLLRRSSSKWLRIPAGFFLVFGGIFSILPILGIWMLPLGLILLAEDIPVVRLLTDRALAWIEYRRPNWMGLPSRSPSSPPIL